MDDFEQRSRLELIQLRQQIQASLPRTPDTASLPARIGIFLDQELSRYLINQPIQADIAALRHLAQPLMLVLWNPQRQNTGNTHSQGSLRFRKLGELA